MNVADLSEVARVGAWLICLAALAPAVWRLVCRRERYLDPIWGVVFLLAINRLSYVLHVSETFSHASAIVLALVMAHFARWYQRHDA